MELQTGNGILLDFEGLVKYAEQGNAEAQYDLALEYATGECVALDYAKMADLLKRSAKQGYDKAEWILGIFYFFGKYVRKNRNKAFALLEKSALAGNTNAEATLKILMELQADNGNRPDFDGLIKYAMESDADALYELALEFATGKYVPKNYARMAELLKQSAEKGYVKAVHLLGICYYFGKGVRKNRKKAFGLLEESALEGNKEAEKTLKELRDYDCIEK